MTEEDTAHHAILFAPSLCVTADISIKRTRELPLDGDLLVEVGTAVSGDNVIGRVMMPGDLRVVRVTKELNILQEQITRVSKVKVGDSVVKGALLAEVKGFFGLLTSRVTAPVSGTIEFITEATGHIGIRLASKKVETRAYISGVVESLIPKKQVTIVTRAAFIQGIFGVGGERLGKIRLLEANPEKELTESDVPHECRGLILIGGCNPTIDFLRCAAEKGAVAVVVGSINNDTLKAYIGIDLGVAVTGNENVPMTIVVTEGFGSYAISKRVLAVAKSCAGNSASVNGATQVRAGAIRPEIIISKNDAASLDSLEGVSVQVLKIGSVVRLTRHPFFGKCGVTTELPLQPEKIDTAAEVRVVRVKIQDTEEIVTVPRANIEVI